MNEHKNSRENKDGLDFRKVRITKLLAADASLGAAAHAAPVVRRRPPCAQASGFHRENSNFQPFAAHRALGPRRRFACAHASVSESF